MNEDMAKIACILPAMVRVFVASTWYDTSGLKGRESFCKARELISADRAEIFAQKEFEKQLRGNP